MQKRENNYSQFIFCLAVLALLFVIAVAPTRSSAEEPRRSPSKPVLLTRVTLDGHSYTYRDLLVDFLQIAYQRHLWFDDPFNRSRGFLLPDFYSQKSLAKYPQWLTEYALREQGAPAFDALNRWNKEITIGIGWPQPNMERDHADGFSQKVERQVLTLQSDLEDVTGLPVRFVPPAQETDTDFARIRIIAGTPRDFFRDNKFKIGSRASGHAAAGALVGARETASGAGVQKLEGLFRDAVRFTPLARAQVEGYFVSDKGNNIDFAVCYIWPHHRDPLFEALVTECLTRAMGLPEMPLLNRSAALGHWNEGHDHHSKRYVLDGPQSNRNPLFISLSALEARTRGDLQEADRLKKEADEPTDTFPHNASTSQQAGFAQLSEYDKFMLSILYCGALKHGMGRQAVLATLVQESFCWTPAFIEGR